MIGKKSNAFFFTVLSLIYLLFPYHLLTQDSCIMLLNEAKEKLFSNNFEDAIRILKLIKSHEDILRACSYDEEVNIDFLLSYCYYYLHGCPSEDTQNSIIDLWVLNPVFSPPDWAFSEWKNCWENISYEGAIEKLENIKRSGGPYESLSNDEKVNVDFLLSFCYYHLHGCPAENTKKSIIDLWIVNPAFSPPNWVSTEWRSCWERVTEICKQIKENYDGGMDFYTNEKYIDSAHKFIKVLNFFEPPNDPLTCSDPELLMEYRKLSQEKINLCQRQLQDRFSDLASQKKTNEFVELEKGIRGIEGSEKYLGSLLDYINNIKKSEFPSVEKTDTVIIDESKNKKESKETKKIEDLIVLEQVRKGWEDYESQLNYLKNQNSTVFSGIDFRKLQDSWNIINRYEPEMVKDAQHNKKLQNAPQEILRNFEDYSTFLYRNFDIQQEEDVQKVLSDYKDYIVKNFPEHQSKVEEIYRSIIDAPQQVFSRNHRGVHPPETETKLKFHAPVCVSLNMIEGTIIVDFQIDQQGNVEKILNLIANLSMKNKCAASLEKRLRRYIQDLRFAPAYKIKYMNASSPLPSSLSYENIIRVKFVGRCVIEIKSNRLEEEK